MLYDNHDYRFEVEKWLKESSNIGDKKPNKSSYPAT